MRSACTANRNGPESVAHSTHGRNGPDVASRHLIGPQVAARQAEGADRMVDQRALLNGPAADLSVLHERYPPLSTDLLQPGRIRDILVRRHSVVLGEGDQGQPRITEQSRNLMAPRAPVDEEPRQRGGMRHARRPPGLLRAHRSRRPDQLVSRRPRSATARRPHGHGPGGRSAGRTRIVGQR